MAREHTLERWPPQREGTQRSARRCHRIFNSDIVLVCTGILRSVPRGIEERGHARFSWLLEFKYLPAGAKVTRIEAAFAEAKAQVARYASDKDLLRLLVGGRELKAGMIVFVGTKEVSFRPWPEETGTNLTLGSPGAGPARRPSRAAGG
jgi:hypothetical protein